MKILDVLNSPWAIVPEKLREITEIYARHLRGEKIDIAAVEAQLGQPLKKEPQGYAVRDGVALLAVDGVLSKRMNIFTRISGGTSLQILARDFDAALADPAVRALVLMVDSPGGTVDGTQDMARRVMEARAGEKPVVAWVDGSMMSGAYWIGSAADAVLIGAGTDDVGSIGVAMQHVDYSGLYEKQGLKVTDIYAGKYKRMGTDAAPLSDEARAYFQAHLDYLYTLFVDGVAAQRGVSSEQVLSDMADGRIFIGQQAIDAGLVDGASTLEALIAELSSGAYRRRRSDKVAAGAAATAQDANGAGAAPRIEAPIHSSEDTMDIKTLRENHPDVAQALVDEGFAAGAQAERERIRAVEAQGLPGHTELVQTLKYDGKTTGPEAAMQINAAERAKAGARLAALKGDAPQPASASASASGDRDAETRAAAAAEEEKLPPEERARKRWERDAQLRGEFASFEDYVAFEKADGEGRVKILAKRAA